MAAQHTPGPFQVVPPDQADHRWVVGDAEGGSVASCEPMGPWMSGEEADANCRLFAAAPDMLAFLREFLALTATVPDDGLSADGVARRDRARALVARATGA